MDNRLDKSDWLRAARLALLHHGPDGVRVEPLARDLGVTKGSFYWHFGDRSDLLEALLKEWEAESSLLIEGLAEANPVEALEKILDEVRRRTLASERGEWPSDVAIFAWAGTDPAVARRVNKTEDERMRLFRNFAERWEMADFFYYAYQGFLARRRRVPKAAKDFDMLARIAMELLPRKTRRKKSRIAARKVAVVGVIALAASLHGCTAYRILRWRDPSADIQSRIFPERIVQHAESPFLFTVAPQRNDLDTVSVRDTDGKLQPFAKYLSDHDIRAFVVIRNDSIIYERYREGYKPSERWSSFSVAKSVASAVLGNALARGIISSLDDSVTKYLPELARNPAYHGVTLRNLMEMKSGLAYTRQSGDLLKDLRSSDAHFYYTNNMKHSLADMRREFPPPASWAYKDSDVELLGWILAKTSGKPVAEQLQDEIWRRIGTEYDATFSLDHPNGLDKVSAGFNATARDYARFGRLYLNGGRWNGVELIPALWVKASTTLDTTRTEPEVTTWYRMQHNHLWWIPMHNWSAEQDFFADGSRGQRIYVHPPTNTIIVQLANDSRQDFPFRKVAHYLAGQSYVYPRGIAGLVRQAGQTYGADSVRAVFTRLSAAERAHPELYFLNKEALLSVASDFEKSGNTPVANAIHEMANEYYRFR